MPLILRVDVDKSYGRSNLLQKIASKIAENYWLPSIPSAGYLHDLKRFLLYLEQEGIRAHIYFRKCTLPPKSWFGSQLLEGHKLGLHAENTRSLETFRKEVEEIRMYFNSVEISSFTKHGSGNWKGGRNHYPLYEPDKYVVWGKILNIPFLFGNDEDMYEECSNQGLYDFYPGAFWIDRTYTNREEFALQKVLDLARERNVVILMHSGSCEVDEQVDQGMKRLISMAQKQGVSWITL